MIGRRSKKMKTRKTTNSKKNRGGHEREVVNTQGSEKRSKIVHKNLYSDRNNEFVSIEMSIFIYRMEFYQRLIW